MKIKKVGDSGLLVSELCLGTMTFGWQADEKTSHSIIEGFVEKGGNFLDTADVYSDGKSEQIIGNWLEKQEREDFVIATKVRFRTSNGVNSVGLSRKHILSSVDASLKRLKTDYVDIIQVHAWDPLTPLEETFETLNDLVHSGKTRYIGVSNFRAWQFQKALDICHYEGWVKPISIQPQYNLIARSTENEIIPMAISENIAVFPWSPLAGGILTGKYTNGISSAPKGTRIGDSQSRDMYTRYENDRTKKILGTLKEISAETGRTQGQIALNWLLANPAITAPIIGARNKEQLTENIGSTGWVLTKDQIRRLDEASRLEVTYPYDQRAEDQQRRDRMLD
jgi:aryl-alcohol dehydrogenase-like predicted oxidoreductase